MPQQDQQPPQPERNRAKSWWKGGTPHDKTQRAMLVFWAFSTTTMILYCVFGAPTWGISIARLGAGLMLGGAAAAIGGVLGFLFGMPHWIDAETPSADAATKPSEAAERKIGRYRQNRSILQLSDWITKTIVGAGLTQLTAAPKAWEFLSTQTAPLFGGEQSIGAGPFGATVVLNYLILGFFYAYFSAEFFMPGAMSEVHDSVEQKLSRVEHSQERLVQSQKMLEQSQEHLNKEIQVARALDALYRPSPQGFTEALALLDGVSSESGAEYADRIDVYRACAYGQKHRWLKQNGGPLAEIDNARNNALSAAKAAVERDLSTRDWIRQLMLGGPGQDDDLSSLARDGEFRSLVGLRGSSRKPKRRA
jgi:hypothetical protein